MCAAPSCLLSLVAGMDKQIGVTDTGAKITIDSPAIFASDLLYVDMGGVRAFQDSK